MRKLNIVITALMVATLLAHMILGGLQLAGIGGIPIKWLSFALLALVALHAVIGIILTITSLKAMHKAKVHYFRENQLFWLRRISGLLILLGILFHLLIFYSGTDGPYRLEPFGLWQLLSQLFLVLSLAIHVISNIRPLFIGIGISSWKRFALDFLLIVCLALVLAFVSFVIYYLRWAA